MVEASPHPGSGVPRGGGAEAGAFGDVAPAGIDAELHWLPADAQSARAGRILM